ncbi:L-threonylcarbamoyladenylate synthase [Actinopolymorpha rutila]|uniref:L-threonylcarbamoyladenylate synthase n=1 Tax=Actinopolymorpha rutila TaxID=446787 RepID=A0A852ZIV4_9ACTN|nr:tRNA threonylcarbamoyl adenosine modification protein (Sua5/YciO/YrdC/YwlC family) [Actinopolymorpha rutila]
MSERYSCADRDERTIGLEIAASAILAGDLVVLPTDTVYGIAADAFVPSAVDALLAAKGRGHSMPPPVLVGSVATLDGIAADIPDAGRALVKEFWPGALTIICRQQPSLVWNIGETGETVAVRMPDEEISLALLEKTGPLAVSSANKSGVPAATTCDDAEEQLGDAVSVYLDGGSTPGSVASTIVDLTGGTPRILRAGAISLARLRAVVPEIEDLG